MPDSEPIGKIFDITAARHAKQERVEQQHTLVSELMTMYEDYVKTGDFQNARTLATRVGQPLHVDESPEFGITTGAEDPTFKINLFDAPVDVQEAAAQALLKMNVDLHNGRETNLTIHTADHAKGHENEAIVSMYTRGVKLDIPDGSAPTLTDLLSMIGQNPGSKVSPGQQRQEEIIPFEAGQRPLLVFVVDGWRKDDKNIVADTPRVTSVMVANVNRNAPRVVPKPPTPPAGAK